MVRSRSKFVKDCSNIARTQAGRPVPSWSMVSSYFDERDIIEYLENCERHFGVIFHNYTADGAIILRFSELIDRMADNIFFSDVPIKKIIYVAGKVTGMEAEAKILFKNAQKELEAIGYIVINPMELPDDHDKSWKSYMRVCLAEMVKADTIYLLNNWFDSDGARIERNLANDLQFDVIYQK